MCFASCREIAKLFFELLCQISLPIGFIWIVVSLWEVLVTYTHSDRARDSRNLRTHGHSVLTWGAKPDAESEICIAVSLVCGVSLGC